MPLGAHIKCMVKEVDDATESPYKIIWLRRWMMPLRVHIKCMVKEVDDATGSPYKMYG